MFKPSPSNTITAGPIPPRRLPRVLIPSDEGGSKTVATTTVVLGSDLGLLVVEALGGGISVDDEDDVGVNVGFNSDVVLDHKVDDNDEDEEETGTS